MRGDGWVEWDPSEVGGTQGTWGSGIETQDSGAGGKCLEGRDPPRTKSLQRVPRKLRPAQNAASEGTASLIRFPRW